jgi:hypothetical protein
MVLKEKGIQAKSFATRTESKLEIMKRQSDGLIEESCEHQQ